jgi:hypothetical protein
MQEINEAECTTCGRVWAGNADVALELAVHIHEKHDIPRKVLV